ncbi:MAG: hypothetical protein JRE73_06305 [Deltaproteobacteria bacterium]|nr:hypothetical protein [Deltaproteobacteria bacterium]
MSLIVFRYLHFLGITFWIGTAVAVAIAASAPTPWESGIAQALRKVTLRVTTPSMLFAFAGGFGMLTRSWQFCWRSPAPPACSPENYDDGRRARRCRQRPSGA